MMNVGSGESAQTLKAVHILQHGREQSLGIHGSLGRGLPALGGRGEEIKH